MMKFNYFFFKIYNFSLKTSAFSCINLLSCSFKNFLCLCRCKNLILNWVNFFRSCCWQTWTNFSSVLKNFSACKIWQIFVNHKLLTRKHFFEQIYLLQFFELSEKMQDLFYLKYKKYLSDIFIFFSLMSWDSKKWSMWCFDMMKKKKNYQNNEFK